MTTFVDKFNPFNVKGKCGIADENAKLRAENERLKAENAQLKAEIDDRHRALLYAHTSTSDLYAALRARVAELEAAVALDKHNEEGLIAENDRFKTRIADLCSALANFEVLEAERDALKAELARRDKSFTHNENGELKAKIAELEAELKMAVYCCVTEAQMSKLVADQIKKHAELEAENAQYNEWEQEEIESRPE